MRERSVASNLSSAASAKEMCALRSSLGFSGILSVRVLLHVLMNIAPNIDCAHSVSHDEWTILRPEALMTTPEIILHRGYPVEIHQVTTEDGYILEMHRIPWSSKAPVDSSIRRKPVLLQHGLFADDHVWLITPGNKALAYILADRGYDVWLANSRGSTYSKRHVTLKTDSKEFWDFSWDEMGKYDLPACLNYVLWATGQPKLSYISHSIGGGIFFIAMNEFPLLNEKIEVAIALSPASSVANTQVFKTLAPILDTGLFFMKSSGMKSINTRESLFNRNFRLFCQQSNKAAYLCREAFFQGFGRNEAGFDMSMLQTIVHHFPSGTSIKAKMHALQNYHSGEKFTRYDHGPKRNMALYGRLQPPEYDLRLVTTPVYIFWSQNDPVTPPEDITWMARHLGNLRASIPVEDPLFSHADFIWSPTAVDLVYNRLLPLLPTPY